MASQNPQSLLELRARGSQPAWGAGGAASAREQAAANSARIVLVGGTGPLLAWLLAEYPGLIWSAAVLSLPAVLLAILPSEPGILATSELVRPRQRHFATSIVACRLSCRSDRAQQYTPNSSRC